MKKKRLIATGVGLVLTATGAVAVLNQGPVETMEVSQEKYFAEHGEYYQVKETDNRFADLIVDIYETPKHEKGYQIRWEDAVGQHSRGYGPEAQARTYDVLKPVLAATTTP